LFPKLGFEFQSDGIGIQHGFRGLDLDHQILSAEATSGLGEGGLAEIVNRLLAGVRQPRTEGLGSLAKTGFERYRSRDRRQVISGVVET
jgi:hypothetical protein